MRSARDRAVALMIRHRGRRVLLVLCLLVAVAVACGSASKSGPTATPSLGTSTGASGVDELASTLLREDLDTLMSHLRYVVKPCQPGAPTLTDGRPQCPAGVVEGAMLRTFPIGGCDEGYDLTSDQQIADVFQSIIGAGRLSVYAVLKANNPGVAMQADYVIAVSADTPASASGQGSLWYVTGDGRIAGLFPSCPSRTLGERIRLNLPDAQYVVGPT